MSDMVRIARNLREVHQFRGYIHLKTIPDAAPALVHEAGLWADRLSINIELPQDESLRKLAPEKQPRTIRRAMAQVRLDREAAQDKTYRGKRPPRFAPAGQSTQMIIGADAANDRQILSSAANLYSGYRLSRVYFSAFSPIPDASASLPLVKPPLMREHRLYQADWLMRFYGFSSDEISTSMRDEHLDLEIDPKLAWALHHRSLFPVDVNRASREMLLRVPGLGTRIVNRIVAARRHHALRVEDLARLGAMVKKARPFISASGWSPGHLLDRSDLRARFLPPPSAAYLNLTYHVDVPGLDIFNAWRSAARRAISHAIPPTKIAWGSTGDLFHDQVLPAADGTHTAVVTHEFLKLAKMSVWHRDPQRFSFLYEALWRLDRREGQPLSHADPLGRHLQLMARAVRRDIHKMHAFVRFRELPSSGTRRRFGAWFEPQHYTLEPGAAFFAKRFADMDWSIATPYLTAHFSDETVQFGPGVARPALPHDATEDLWATYFVNIFNPARIKLSAMTSEMPKLYWKNLPETQLIPDMIAHAEARARKMRDAGSTEARPGSKTVVTRYRDSIKKPVDAPRTLSEARDAALACQRCALWSCLGTGGNSKAA